MLDLTKRRAPLTLSGPHKGAFDLTAWLDEWKFRFPAVVRPVMSVRMKDTTVELWVSKRRLALMLHADAMIVPVSPDLKMVFGVAKVARDAGASRAQYEADRVAPLEPGQAFVGAGAKYHFKYTALAVIFDEMKRTSPSLIRKAVREATLMAAQRGAKSVILPDMTENLLAQPNWITTEEYRATAVLAAAATGDAIRACRGAVKTIKVWVWDPASLDLYKAELKRLAGAS